MASAFALQKYGPEPPRPARKPSLPPGRLPAGAAVAGVGLTSARFGAPPLPSTDFVYHLQMKNRVLLASALLALLSSPAARAQSWVERDLGSASASLGVQDFDMPTPNVIWGINYDGTTSPGNPTQDMFLSTDGGITWFTNVITTASSANLDLANISAIDGTKAFVAAYDRNATGYTGFLFKTTDGGNTWSDVTIPSMPWLNFVHFFSPTEGFLMSDPDNIGYALYRTTDAGVTWTQVPAANIPAPATDDYGLTNQFAAVGNHLWFGTFTGQVYHSADRGLTWTRSASGFTPLVTPTSSLAALRNIAFADSLNGLIVGRTRVVKRTTNGGATWVTFTPRGPFFASNITAVPGSPNTYVSTGSNPTEGLGSSVSYDAGQTWTLLDTALQHTAVIFRDRQHGWAGGFTSQSGTGGVFEYVGMPLATAREIGREKAAVYPNPTTGLVRLAGADPRETVTVLDLTGRVLRRLNVAADGQLDLRGLDAGLYQLTITGGRTPRTARVALER